MTHPGEVSQHSQIEPDIGLIPPLIHRAIPALLHTVGGRRGNAHHDVIDDSHDDVLRQAEFAGHLVYRQVARVICRLEAQEGGKKLSSSQGMLPTERKRAYQNRGGDFSRVARERSLWLELYGEFSVIGECSYLGVSKINDVY